MHARHPLTPSVSYLAPLGLALVLGLIGTMATGSKSEILLPFVTMVVVVVLP